jgi:hypothetical protein
VASLAVDPCLLLTLPPGRWARVSVISFVGLHDLQQRQIFVNQLQLALFSWIKRHPAGTGRSAGSSSWTRLRRWRRSGR